MHPGIHLLMIYPELFKDEFAANEQYRARKKCCLPVLSTSESPWGDFLGWGRRLDLHLQGMFLKMVKLWATEKGTLRSMTCTVLYSSND